MEITAEQLRAVIHYSPETGVFTRLVRLANRHHAGDRADTAITSPRLFGYRRVGLFSQRYMAHRLAWLYVYGEWPKLSIDHINGDKGDNRICNLREADDRINLENLRKAKITNKVGLLGVIKQKDSIQWRARIQVRGKGIHLGLFKSPEEAHQAYLVAKRKYHEGCTI
jgi:hypothetical protein